MTTRTRALTLDADNLYPMYLVAQEARMTRIATRLYTLAMATRHSGAEAIKVTGIDDSIAHALLILDRRGRILDEAQTNGTYTTRTGAVVEAFMRQPGDDNIVSDPCVWCEGEGHAGGGAPDDELQANPGLMLHDCQACQGTGVSGTTTVGDLRLKAWKEMVFNIDARRYELRDRDICPDCGAGGCGGECYGDTDLDRLAS